MSSVGSPGTAMMSARKPGTNRPRSSALWTRSALVTVDATMASTGRMPRCTSAHSSFQFCPCGMAGASVPVAIFAPASIRRAIVFLAIGKTSAAFACSSGAAFDTSMPSERYDVGTMNVPRSSASSCVSSLMSDACSMQSMPASIAALIPWSPCACAATRMPAPMGFVDDRPQLLVGVVLRTRGAGERHHAARRAHLDLRGAVLDLVAHRPADLADPVGDPLFDGQGEHSRCEALEHGRIEVSTAGRDGVPGGEDPGPGDPSGVDRLHERDVEEQAAGLHEQPEVAHGGEAGEQRLAHARDRPHELHRRVVLHRAHQGAARPTHEEVQLHVHEPRQQGEVAELDDLGVVGDALGRDVADALALHDHHARLDDRCARRRRPCGRP